VPINNPGAGNDAVTLKVNGNDLKIFTSYTVRKSILTQPSQFNVQLGYGELKSGGHTTKDILELIPPNSPFQLYVNNALQQTGFTDGFEASTFATEVQLFGRDNLKLIHDAFVMADVAFENATYLSLTQKVFDILEIKQLISASDEANLRLTMGVGIPNFNNPNTIDQIEQISEQPGSKVVRRAITAKLAETYFQFLQRQYRRAGLFLWAAGDGSFILSEPNSDQPPSYRIVRHRGQFRNAVSVLSHRWRNDITHRYTSGHVYGRASGRKGGRAKTLGEFVHDETFKIFGGDFKPIAFRDVNVSTRAQAEFFARRKLAEFNRSAWQLQYTVSGHTAPNIITGLPSTWCPNTMVEIQDDELGIRGEYYLEEVVFSRPPTTTTLTFMKPGDLIFKSSDDEA
jgi:prophage tail gpP-like protein